MTNAEIRIRAKNLVRKTRNRRISMKEDAKNSNMDAQDGQDED